ncbi:MAG: hypothetical protein Q7J57_14240 [Gemmobacter sp.]|nr:hypothetical protein [Gemmobacter sp.]
MTTLDHIWDDNSDAALAILEDMEDKPSRLLIIPSVAVQEGLMACDSRSFPTTRDLCRNSFDSDGVPSAFLSGQGVALCNGIALVHMKLAGNDRFTVSWNYRPANQRFTNLQPILPFGYRGPRRSRVYVSLAKAVHDSLTGPLLPH